MITFEYESVWFEEYNSGHFWEALYNALLKSWGNFVLKTFTLGSGLSVRFSCKKRFGVILSIATNVGLKQFSNIRICL